MRRPALLALALLPVAAGLVSCMLPAEPGHEAEAAVAAPSESPVLAPVAPDEPGASPTTATPDEDDRTAPELQHFLPLGVFSSVEALCAAQERLVTERIEQIRKEMTEGGFQEIDVRPRCDIETFTKVDVQLRAPYLEVRAIAFETGYATRKHVVVRTADGWRALSHAFEDDVHMDPGCFSIERETGLQAIRVEGPALVLVDGTDRGASMDPGPDEDHIQVSWSDLTKRATACRIEDGAATCDAPVVLRVERVPSTTEEGRASSVRFETSYTVDARGHVSPSRAFDAAAFAD